MSPSLKATNTRPPRRPREVAEWLRRRPTLSQVRAVYPAEWDRVQVEIAAIVARGDVQQIKDYLARAATPPQQTPGHARPAGVVQSETIRRYLTVEALRQASLHAETGCRTGRLRFGLINGYVLQKLLFERGLRRKPVSLPVFRTVWPMLTQRRYLMPLVSPEGIYCFYSRPLVKALARLIGDRTCLEIAAGDGTLSRFLTDRGVRITATDDHSWQDSVHDDQSVARMDATKALRSHRPQVVICSWPPAGNTFERHIFTTPGVELYLLISTELEYAAGDWDAYRSQTAFDLAKDGRLSRLVLPPDGKAAVYTFRRRPSASARSGPPLGPVRTGDP